MNYYISNEEGIMVFTEKPLSELTVAAFAMSCGVEVDDVCEVTDDEVRFYVYSPVWVMSDEQYQNIVKRADKWIESQTDEQISKFCKRLGLRVPRMHRGHSMSLELR